MQSYPAIRSPLLIQMRVVVRLEPIPASTVQEPVAGLTETDKQTDNFNPHIHTCGKFRVTN